MNIYDFRDQLQDAFEKADPQRCKQVASRIVLSGFPSTNYGGKNDFSRTHLFLQLRLLISTISLVEHGGKRDRAALKAAISKQKFTSEPPLLVPEQFLARGVVDDLSEHVLSATWDSVTISATKAREQVFLSAPFPSEQFDGNASYDGTIIEEIQWILSELNHANSQIFTVPLRQSAVNQLTAQTPRKSLRDYLSHTDFAFWRDWYQGFLDGKPLDWELQRRVALIPEEDWEKGAEHIAKRIEDIRARFELEKRIEALEAEKQVWEERARHGVGGNNPPEEIEDTWIVQEIIWAPIEDLKVETQSDTPDRSRIQAAISKLGAALIAVGKWSLGKLDTVADAFAKSIGGGIGGYCVGWITQNGDKIAEIIKAAQNWLTTLS